MSKVYCKDCKYYREYSSEWHPIMRECSNKNTMKDTPLEKIRANPRIENAYNDCGYFEQKEIETNTMILREPFLTRLFKWGK